jgi:nitroreductase
MTRRSVPTGFLSEPGPTPDALEAILTMGTRVPDHAKLTPWRLIIVEGDARYRAGEALAALAKKKRPDIDEASLEVERRQFLPAPLSIGVISAPRPHPKAPELEQVLSAGLVAFNLSNAAFAMGFAACWVSRWFCFDLEGQHLMGARGGERFIGFVHIGTPTMKPEERERPVLNNIVSRWPG